MAQVANVGIPWVWPPWQMKAKKNVMSSWWPTVTGREIPSNRKNVEWMENPKGPMGREYLPTFPLECGHFSPNVGKYSIHGFYGKGKYLATN